LFLLLFSLAMLHMLAGAQAVLRIVNSDMAFFPLIFRDVHSGATPLSGWIRSPNNYIFPDQFLTYICSWILPGFWGQTVLYMTSTFAICLLCWVWLARASLENWRPAALLVLAGGGVLAWLGSTPHHTWDLAHLTYMNLHGSAVWVSVLILSWTLRLESRWVGWEAGLLWILTAVTAWSDRVFLAHGPLALALALGATWRLGRLGGAYAKRPILLMLTAAAAGGALQWLTVKLKWFRIFAEPVPPFDAERTVRTAWQVLRDMGSWYMLKPVVASLLVVTVAWALLELWREARHKRGIEEHAARRLLVPVYVLCCFAMAVTGPALQNKWVGYSTIRYVQPLVVFPFFCAPLALAGWTPAVFRRWKTLLAGIVLLDVVLLPVWGTAFINGEFGRLPYPPEVACADRWTAERGLKAGQAFYWISNRLMFYSRNDLRLAQIWLKGEIFPVSTNLYWYLGSRGADGVLRDRRFDYIIVNEVDEHSILGRYGEPAERGECSGWRIWRYHRPQDQRFRQGVRTEAIQRMRFDRIEGEWLPKMEVD
jgi:hypothetical protein